MDTKIQEKIDGLMEVVKATIAKRDKGEALAPLERIVMVATQNDPDRIPTGTFFTDSIANHYGHTCRQVESDPELHSDLIRRWYEDFDMEFVCEGIDSMTSEIDAMGLITRKYPENVPADIKTRLFDDMDDEQMLAAWEKAVESFNPETDGRLPLRLKLYELLMEKTASAGYPVIAAPSSTFAQVVQAMGYKRAVLTMRKKPDLFHKAMALQVQANIRWCQAIADRGVHGFICIDAWNAVPNFRKEQLFEFEKPYVRDVIEALVPAPCIHFYWGLRMCGPADENDRGGWIEFLEKSAETGTFTLTNLAPDYYTEPSNDLALYRKTAQRLNKSYIVGIKDEIMQNGTPDEIRNEVRSVVKGLYPCDKGCIIVPNNIPMGTPGENVTAFLDALHEVGTYPIPEFEI
ncbi:MAG: uroporphyrinogen decarboxylase family protein [Desulfopila sp.]|jgi:uroporphyrinogen decarboxylase|nr:uroporphyrinogen decarboxylase family protein [Desulfopila sp.]